MCYELGLHVLRAKLCFVVSCSRLCCMYYELGFVSLLPIAGYVAYIISKALFYCYL